MKTFKRGDRVQCASPARNFKQAVSLGTVVRLTVEQGYYTVHLDDYPNLDLVYSTDFLTLIETKETNMNTSNNTNMNLNIHNNVVESVDSLDLNELRHQLGINQDLLKEAQEAVDNFEYNPSDDDYDAWLDELHGSVYIAGMTYDTSDVLKNIDPAAYRVGHTDFIDSVDIEDLGEYKELVQERDNAQAAVDSLLEQIADLESV